MENDAGEFVDLYCPRKWYVLFHVFKLSFFMENKSFLVSSSTIQFFFKKALNFQINFHLFFHLVINRKKT